MSLQCIVWCCMVLYCWLWRAGCISQDTYLLYDNNLHSCLLPTNLETYYSISSSSQVTYLCLNWDFPSRSWSWSSWTPSWSWSAPCWSYLTQVTCFSLSCDSGDPSQRQMLAIGLEEGRVEVVFIIVISIIVIIIHIGLEELVFIVVCIILISIIIIHIQLEEGLVEVIFILRCSYSPFLASLFTSGREGLIQETYHHYHPHCRHCHHHHYHCHHHVHCHLDFRWCTWSLNTGQRTTKAARGNSRDFSTTFPSYESPDDQNDPKIEMTEI